ncbi:LuxR C-terminal-related transcriptional regulator [Micromonospora aurantiaca]|uniref:LuxR C-terminal-related transcriptional regulator n=1 Tax=Micromonospora aurantiaca (nom. illeg.) TaxID=47850 RepID=UPI0033ABFE2C
MRSDPVLGALGVGAFDERVYRLLLAEPRRPLAASADALAATPTRVRTAVTRLARLGLVRRISPGHYEAVSPEAALTTLVARRRLAHETALNGVQAAIGDFDHLFRTARLSDPARWVEVVTGAAVAARMDEVTTSIRPHFWVLDRPPYRTEIAGVPRTNEAEAAMTASLVAQGVDLRSVYCPDSMYRPGRFELLVRLSEAGEQARMLPSLPFKLRIVDLRVAVVSLTGDGYDNLALIHPSGLLDALIELFLVYWNQGTPLTSDRPPVEDGPSDEELLLLRLLRAGLKDEAIARQIGVSARTATRRIAALIDRLGATSRFQAGAEAAARGWL